MVKKILITGATGLIGKKIVKELCSQGAFVKIVSTDSDHAKQIFNDQFTIEAFDWSDYDTPAKLSELIEDTNAVINLAGANVGESRWTKDFKNKIYNSRIETTKLIVKAIGLCTKKPVCLINASAVGIYGFRGDEALDEESGPGDDFLANLCRDWEKEAMKALEFDIRVVTVRTGIVLDKNNGALKNFILPFKFFIGAYMGNGKQWFPWIHIEDVVSLFIFALENENLSGAVNGVAPEEVTNKQFIKTVGSILKKNILISVPKIFLTIGVGEFANNLCTGQKIYPGKALKYGFNFRFPELKEALTNLLKEN